MTDKYKAATDNFKERVDLIRQFDEENYEFAGLKLSSFDFKKWTKQDYINYASHSVGFTNVQNILYVCNHAAAKRPVLDSKGNPIVENGKTKMAYTPDALLAQAALNDIRPNSCKTWQEFYYLMAEVQQEAGPAMELLNKKYPAGINLPPATPKASRGTRKTQGNTGMLPKEYRFENIAGDVRDDATFNEAQALELLQKSGVAVDASHELKKPLETAVTDAVKGIKSSVVIAA